MWIIFYKNSNYMWIILLGIEERVFCLYRT